MAKHTKAQCHYRKAEGDKSCGNCKHYDGQGGCSLVSGTIHPKGLCDYFHPKAVNLTAETTAASTVPEPFGKPSGPGLWHVKGMELPPYIQHVAHDLLSRRPDLGVGGAIAMAKHIVEMWAAGKTVGGEKGHIHPDVRAAATKAIADWEAKRGRAHAQRSHEHSGGTHVTDIDLA